MHGSRPGRAEPITPHLLSARVLSHLLSFPSLATLPFRTITSSASLNSQSFLDSWSAMRFAARLLFQSSWLHTHPTIACALSNPRPSITPFGFFATKLVLPGSHNQRVISRHVEAQRPSMNQTDPSAISSLLLLLSLRYVVQTLQ